MKEKIYNIYVQGAKISAILNQTDNDNDYLSLTDIANKFGTTKLIENWLQNKDTIEFLGVWESLYNKNFDFSEFQELLNEARSMSIKKWVIKTNAIGIKGKAGKYGGTYAHKEIATAFCEWISPEFKLYISLKKGFQKLEKEEAEKKNQINDSNIHIFLTKLNDNLQTDAIRNHIVPTIIKRKAISFKLIEIQ